MLVEKLRRPNQKYLAMGLKVGDRLIFELLPEEEVRIASDTKLVWQGRERSLANLKKMFGPKIGRSRYPDKKIVVEKNGHRLYDVYLNWANNVISQTALQADASLRPATREKP